MEEGKKATAKEEEEKEEHRAYAMQLGNSIVLPMVMHAAIELDVLEIIAKAGPGALLSAAEIAAQLTMPPGASPNPEAPAMLDRMLRLLVSCAVLVGAGSSSDVEERYGLAPVAKYFVRNQDGASLGPVMALLHDKVFVDSWFELKNAVVEGGVPFDRVHGTHAFEYPGKDPRFNSVFNKAMVNHTTLVIKELLLSYQGFGENRPHLTLVDVGGGLGVALNIITSTFPNIKGVNFDLPHVIHQAPSYPGVEHVGGDMFESVPKGDAIFMKWILHDWSDEHCLKLLKNCYKALPDYGKVIVVEVIRPEVPDSTATAKSIYQLDLLMMTQNPGGKERTQKEFEALATKAGFAGIRLECTAFNFWIMEFYK